MTAHSALNVTGALLAAQRQSFWNRLRRESNLGGPLATRLTFGLVALLLILPAWFALRLGVELGEELRAEGASALPRWLGFQALFTVGFAFLGSFRLRPAFDLTRLGHHPIPPLQLLAAELPAGLFEVFPLLGGAAILMTHAGLALVLPGLFPAILLMALQALAAMLALLFLAAAARRWLVRRPRLAAGLALAAAAGLALAGSERLRLLLRDELPRFVAGLPGSAGYRGLVALRAGDLAAGLTGLALAVGATLALLLLAAWSHHAERATAVAGGGRAGRAVPLRFATPAGAVARLHLRQLLASRSGRLALALPLLLFGPFAGVLALLRSARGQEIAAAADLAAAVVHLEHLPVLAWSLVAVVLLGSPLWMNQFGWDRGGVRGLLALPLDPRDLLLGKLLGLVRFTALQAPLALLPLLVVAGGGGSAMLADGVSAVAAGAVALVVAGGAGQYFSLRFPRAVSRDGAANLPLFLSWIPTLLGLLLVAVLAGFRAIAAELSPWAPPVVLLALAAGATLAYRWALPALARLLGDHQERLLRM